MKIQPVSLQLYKPLKQTEQLKNHTLPANDTFVRSTPSFEGNSEITEEFKQKLKNINLSPLYNEFIDYASYYEVSNPDSPKTEKKYSKPVCDLMINMLKNGIDSMFILDFLPNLQYRSKDGYAKFDEFAVKNCMSLIPLPDNCKDLGMLYNKLSRRLELSRGEDGRIIPETFNKFNEVLKDSDDWASTSAYMQFITDENTHYINKNTCDKAETFVKQGVPYHLVKPVYVICTEEDETIKKKNCDKIIKFIKDYSVSHSEPITMFKLCKNRNNEITDEAYSLYKKIYERFESLNIIKTAANYCISTGKADEEMFNSLVKLEDKCKQKSKEDENIIEMDRYIFSQCLDETKEELSSDIINGFLKFVDKNNVSSLDYASILKLCSGKDGKFSEVLLNKIIKLRDAAFERRDILRNGNEDLTDEDINSFFYENSSSIIATIELMGENNYIYAYSNKMDYLSNMTEKFSKLKADLPQELYDELQAKTNPAASEVYIQQKQLLRTLKAELNDKKSPEYKEFETLTNNRIKHLLEQISKIKQTTLDTTEIKKLHSEIKQLQFNLRQKKTPEITALEGNINNANSKIKNLINSSVKDPQDVIKLLNIISAFKSDENAVKNVIMMFPTDTAKKKEELNLYLAQKIFKLAGVEYDEKTADKLNLTKSRYLAEMFSTGQEFLEYFSEMINILKENPDKSLKEIFNELPQNIETREGFEKLGIDYDKWTDADKNSFIKVSVQTNLENARQAAIKNIEEDFNDELWNNIPPEETAKILNALKQSGFEFKPVNEVNYVGDGFEEGMKEKLRLFKDNKRIEHNDLETVIKIIKHVLNENAFWSVENEDKQIENAKEIMYTHLMKLRENEIKNISKLKHDEETHLEVHKTDMNNIAHSLFLGNQAHCCTAVGGGLNEHSAVTYIMNKMVSAIEVMDGKEFVGNTMCYLAEINDKPALFLDNIELAPKYQYNDKVRDAIFEYAAKLCAEIGKPDMEIYAGPNRHKVNMPSNTIEERKIKLMGCTGENEIYLDFVSENNVIGDENLMDELEAYVNGGIYTETNNVFSANTFKIR